MMEERKPNEPLKVMYVTPHSIYNTLLMSNFLLVDLRDFATFKEDHIKTAMCVPIADLWHKREEEKKKKILKDEAKNKVTLLHEVTTEIPPTPAVPEMMNHDHIEVHHEEKKHELWEEIIALLTSSADKSRWMLRPFSNIFFYDECSKNLSSSPFVGKNTLASSNPGQPTSLDLLELFLSALASDPKLKTKHEVFLVEGGFQAFKQLYPFLCLPSSPLPLSPDCTEEEKQQFEREEKHAEEPKKLANLIYPSECIPAFLFLGGRDSAGSREVLDGLKITGIVNMMAEGLPAFPDDKNLHYYHCAIEDTATTKVNHLLVEVIDFIEERRKNNERVLVHCAMGISRSSTIVIAYFMKYLNMTFDQAYGLIKQYRPQINPNPGFVTQLKEFEEYLKAEKEMVQQLSGIHISNHPDNNTNNPAGVTKTDTVATAANEK